VFNIFSFMDLIYPIMSRIQGQRPK